MQIPGARDFRANDAADLLGIKLTKETILDHCRAMHDAAQRLIRLGMKRLLDRSPRHSSVTSNEAQTTSVPRALMAAIAADTSSSS